MRSRGRAWVVALGATLFSAATAADTTAPEAGPARGPVPSDRAERNASCVGCHADIADEWRASMHRASFVDPSFQRALASEPLPFCRGCHAPEADPSRPPPTRAAEIGVACVTCHTGEAHAPVRDARAGTDAACAGCHEFAFPGPRRPGRIEWMQSTVIEHTRSPYASTACASCHMPWVGQGASRHRNHSFGSTRSPAALQRALSVRVTRIGERARFALAPQGVGHAFPSGDLFRRIALLVEAVDAEGTVRARSSDYLGRRFDVVRQDNGGYGTVCVEDDRLVAPTDVSLPLPAIPPSTKLRWRVLYQRIQHPTSSDEASAVSSEDVELARGVLDPAKM